MFAGLYAFFVVFSVCAYADRNIKHYFFLNTLQYYNW